jgi:Holliday junction resolvase-like predicted endonuclease
MKQILKNGEKNKIGAYGELIVQRYLEKHDYTILDTNYLKQWGEIDLVAQDTLRIVRFIEVKTVSYETKSALEKAISHATYRPEENVHPRKLLRLHRAIQSWLEEKRYDGEWQIDVAAVRIVPAERYATAKFIPNVF